jgi:hypothetical protein
MYALQLLLMAATVSKGEAGEPSRQRPFFPCGGMNARQRSFPPFPHYAVTSIHTACRVISGYKTREWLSRQHTLNLSLSIPGIRHTSSPTHHLCHARHQVPPLASKPTLPPANDDDSFDSANYSMTRTKRKKRSSCTLTLSMRRSLPP